MAVERTYKTIKWVLKRTHQEQCQFFMDMGRR